MAIIFIRDFFKNKGSESSRVKIENCLNIASKTRFGDALVITLNIKAGMKIKIAEIKIASKITMKAKSICLNKAGLFFIEIIYAVS